MRTVAVPTTCSQSAGWRLLLYVIIQAGGVDALDGDSTRSTNHRDCSLSRLSIVLASKICAHLLIRARMNAISRKPPFSLILPWFLRHSPFFVFVFTPHLPPAPFILGPDDPMLSALDLPSPRGACPAHRPPLARELRK
ncbi:hypothetical protein BJ912DRAFT_1060894 [Pholiota molesta]|nr:hypothetical protein BJ912DRAFT_1060894 [Pholiota molesta]